MGTSGENNKRPLRTHSPNREAVRMEASTNQSPIQFIQDFLRHNPEAAYAHMVGEWESRGYRGRPAESLFKRVKRSMSEQFRKSNANGRPSELGLVVPLPEFNVPARLAIDAYQVVQDNNLDADKVASYARRVLAAIPPTMHDPIQQLIPQVQWLDDLYGERLAARIGHRHSSETAGLYWDGRQATLRGHCSCGNFAKLPCVHILALVAILDRTLHHYFLPGGAKGGGPQTELLLDCLEAMSDGMTADRARAVQPASPSRLVWKIDPQEDDIRIEPAEQQLSAKGKWSAGRGISPNDLLKRPTLWRDTVHQTFVIGAFCRGADQFGYGFRQGSLNQFASFLDLVGNPFVVLKQTLSPLVIERSALELCIGRAEGAYSLDVKVADLSVEDCQIFWFDEGCVVFDDIEERLFVCPCDDELADRLEMLLDLPSTRVPESRGPELFAKISVLESILPVRLEAEVDLPSRAASVQPVLRLNPTSTGGLTTEVRVRPFDKGRLEIPGVGSSTRIASEEDGVVCYSRSFEDELETMRGILDRLGVAEDLVGPEWRLQCKTPDESLDLIGRLRQLSAEDAIVEWPEGQAMRVLGTIAPHGLRVELKSQRDWFGLEGGCELDGEKIDLASLLASVRSGSRYVALGPGKWAMIEQGLRDRLTALADAAHASRSGLQIGRTALPFIKQLEDLSVEVNASQEWQDWVKRLDATDVADAQPSSTLTAELRDYQLHGYQWLRKLSNWGVGACLADDMGLGKTVQTLALLIDRVECGPALVIAPTSVCHNWVDESKRFAPSLRPVLHRESDRADIVGQLQPGDVLITSYGLLREYLEPLCSRKWGTLVLDEAHFVKNAATKTAQAVRTLEADWRLALTGTPLENHLGELWSLFRAVSPGLLGSWEQFKKRFAEPIERSRDEERRTALSRLIRPFILRRRKDEVLTELPPRSENVRFAEFSKSERNRYEEERVKSLLMLTENQKPGEDKRFQVLAALTRLRQLSCHPKLVDPAWKSKSSAKLDAFLELVEELQEGSHKALVFSQFVQHLELIRQALDDRDVKYLYLDGQTSPKRRKELVQAFQNGEADFFLISLKAGGTGLNLTAADYVIHMDPWWNPAVEDQASDRAHRIGQNKSVTVFRIVAKGTIEEQILSLHDQKRQLVSDVLDGTDQAARLSTDDLVELIRSGGQ